MKTHIILILLLIWSTFSAFGQKANLPLPTATQLQWQDAELVAVFHYDLHVFDGKRYHQPENRITPISDYNIFKPTQYDTDQWIKSIKDAGFKMAIFTVSHETGFYFHQSDATPYSMKALKWQDGKGDVLRDFKASCEKYGILPGVYIGIRWNSFYGIHDFKVNGEGTFAENRQKHYNQTVEKVVEEVFTRYGDWAIVWFDGGAHGPEQGGADVLSVFEKHQPNCLFYHNLQRADMRWGGSESGTVPYPCWGTFDYPAFFGKDMAANNFQLLKTGDPNGRYYMPAMSDFPFRGDNGYHEWFWEPNTEKAIFPLDALVEKYYKSVGRNSSLIVGLTPNADGLMPETDVKRLKEWGAEIKRRFSRPIATTQGKGSEIILKLPKKTTINHVILQENIERGERVRKFSLEAKVKGKWTQIYEGSCIGHKHIIPFEDVQTSQIRLSISEYVAEADISNFAAFKIESE